MDESNDEEIKKNLLFWEEKSFVVASRGVAQTRSVGWEIIRTWIGERSFAF